MGVTIHYRIGFPYINKDIWKTTEYWTKEKIQKELKECNKTIKEALNRAEDTAKTLCHSFEIKPEIYRESDKELIINLPGCESLVFDFKTKKELQKEAEKEWNYQHQTLKDNEYYTEDDIYTSAFCKTQYAENQFAHIVIAETIRSVAMFSLFSYVSDEADYYSTRNVNNIIENIGESKKMIDGVFNMLKGMGFKDTQIIKGEDLK